MGWLQHEVRGSAPTLIRLLRGRHKPAILIRLGKGTHRFAELWRAIPGLSERMLARQLDELERDGLVSRRVYPEVPPRRMPSWLLSV